jgi:hypothetical protein
VRGERLPTGRETHVNDLRDGRRDARRRNVQNERLVLTIGSWTFPRKKDLCSSLLSLFQVRSKGMANYAYASGSNRKRTQNCAKVVFLSYNRNFSIMLFELSRCCLFVHTTCELNDEIMKIAQGHLNKKIHMKELPMNLPARKTEKFKSLKLTLQ